MTNEEIEKYQETKQKGYNTFKHNFDYVIVAIVSLVALIAFPALESAITGELNYPTSTQGWIFWGIGRVAVTIVNCVIFFALDDQAEKNSQDNENYKRARSILIKEMPKKHIPKSPEQVKRITIAKKLPSIIFGSAATLVALSQIVFNYSLSTLVSYIVTLASAIIFAVWNMIKKELDYWCYEYLEYALKIEQENKEKEKALQEQEKQKLVAISKPQEEKK